MNLMLLRVIKANRTAKEQYTATELKFVNSLVWMNDKNLIYVFAITK